MRLIDADALVGDIERRLCGPCRKAGDDRRGVYCRVCQVNDMLCEIDEWPTFEAETRDTQREDGNDESQT